MTYILGLTGGIASGKTTVSQMFQSLGIPLIDCDLIARQVVEPGTSGLERVVACFGSEILQANGALNRQKLGAIIFGDEVRRKELDQLLADLIHQAFMQEKTAWQAQKVPLVVADVPLLFEAGYQKEVDEVMVVYVPEAVQCRRLMERNHYSQKEAEERIHSQLALEEKRQQADVVIDNCGTLEATRQQVFDWLQQKGFIA